MFSLFLFYFFLNLNIDILKMRFSAKGAVLCQDATIFSLSKKVRSFIIKSEVCDAILRSQI